MVVSSSSRRAQRSNNFRPDRPGRPSREFSMVRGAANSPLRSPRPPLKKSGNRSAQPVPFAPRNSRTRLQAMPSQMPLPRWLRLLKKTEKMSLTVAFALVTAAVATYGWAVYSQQQWGKNFSHLNTLRRDERQLLKSSELMKNNIARNNDPKQYGLVPRNAEHIVVIPPAPLRPALPTRNAGPDPKAKPITPIGY